MLPISIIGHLTLAIYYKYYYLGHLDLAIYYHLKDWKYNLNTVLKGLERKDKILYLY